jgi:nucleotide-binding universal stress UspA family protein
MAPNDAQHSDTIDRLPSASRSTHDTQAGETATLITPLDGSDFSESAAQLAAVIAERSGAQLTIMTAVANPTTGRAYLEGLVRRLGLRDARLDVRVGREPGVEIARAAVENSLVTLCMTTHGRGRIREAMLGSTAEEVIRTVESPILLVGPHCDLGEYRRGGTMLVALNESEVAERVLPAAIEWAARLDLDVCLVEVQHPLDVRAAEHPNAYLDSAANRWRDRNPNIRTIVGWSSFPQGEIVRIAEDIDAAVIAMGTHGQSGLPRLALGSVTIGVAHAARVPVLTIGRGGMTA